MSYRIRSFLRLAPLMLSGGIALLLLALFPLQAVAAVPTLDLAFTGLEDLGSGWVYEGWLIENGAPVSSGTFTVDGSGNPSQSIFSVAVDINDVTIFVLTIEPDPDGDPAPSPVHVLGGNFNAGSAALSADHPAALGYDYTLGTGSYILAAPSDDTGTGTYKNGIWWLDPAAGPGPALDLPTLDPADGWVYEGWVVGSGGPISTGFFTDTAKADSDGPGATGGSNPAPPFPGQDFINPAPVDLTGGYAAVISIEPYPDNSPNPFTFKPLVDSNIDDPGAGGMLQDMANNTAASFPTGTATLMSIPTSVGLSSLGGATTSAPLVALLAIAFAGGVALLLLWRRRVTTANQK